MFLRRSQRRWGGTGDGSSLNNEWSSQNGKEAGGMAAIKAGRSGAGAATASTTVPPAWVAGEMARRWRVQRASCREVVIAI